MAKKGKRFVVDGANVSRLQILHNDLERKFVRQWEKEHANHDALALILNKRSDEVTKEDRMVAATLIQWLGSPVGCSFIEMARGEENERR